MEDARLFLQALKSPPTFDATTPAFVLGFPSVDPIKETDYLDVESGYKADKLKNIDFTTREGKTVYAPIINELPLSLECEVVHTVTIGSHMQVADEVKRIIADESILDEKDKLVLEKLKPIIYDEEQVRYLCIGEKASDAFTPGMAFKKLLAEE